ncbi:glycine cleavage system aminomethyltransferase GcvT [Trichococcus pasteurii]|uniref:Aminomethyltransferase n=1 Tax=Trichococcus pasteurii TaxID=43064 RepID=A0A1W1IFV5_9LACT|nr:glycine cleavage system aminomethyltransferase GcvT [Trichococcus pasteurii]SFE44982.1 aminomethyltransferase [Trichococcus pasteurii]SLM51653.1 glycine cleavage system t protein [Trichococcus pasteurii]SSB92534.1 glycine cleavage system t protein [Trichococcus pasteurii]
MSEPMIGKRTPLFEYYKANGVKLIDFGGWEMPIQFSGILAEHEAVRERAGLFDCSHMGEIEISGNESESYLNGLLTNDVSVMTIGQAQYNIMCYPNGGAVDDVILFKLDKESYLLVCNASNTDKVYAWMEKNNEPEAILKNISDSIGLLALQGPAAIKILKELTGADLDAIGNYHFVEDQVVAGIPHVLISRTGYTGEDGFELYVASGQTASLWEKLLAAGEDYGLLPCGLGSRDTLRLEAGMPLYGHELSEEITPLAAGLGFAVKTNKTSDFIGKAALTAIRENGATEKIVGFEATERGIPREGYKVFSSDGAEIGVVTSGTQSPTLKKSIGMALVKSEAATIGTEIQIEIRNKRIQATIIPKPFYKRTKS